MKKLIGVTLVGLAVIGLLVHTSIQPAIPAAVPKEVDVINIPRPSQIVTLARSNTTCATAGFIRMIEKLPDGTTAGADFDVPAGQVFVVTSFQWFVLASNSSRYHFVTLIRETKGAGTVADGAFSMALADGSGDAGATMNMTTGFVVDSSAVLCYNGSNILLQGYFASDN